MAEKIVVIGSGFGGLAASLRLKAKGFHVTLVEKHPDLGGRARVFKKGNFIYDGGPTVITAPYLFEELFSLYNKNISDYVKIVPLICGIDLYSVTVKLLIIRVTMSQWRKKLKSFQEMIFWGIKN